LNERHISATSLKYPALGALGFCLLSFAHDGFELNRSLSTYLLPMMVGLVMGSTIGYFRTKIENRTRMYERQLSKEREDAALGRAAATIAHEVRNPLNVIAIGLQRLQIEVPGFSPEQRRLVDLMLESVYRANGILGNLLRYARQPSLNIETVDFARLLEDSLFLYRPLCDEHRIAVHRSVSYDIPILGDPGLLRQLIDNLLKNAIEAQPDGGDLEIELKRDGGTVALAVRNKGFALPSKEVERIFEPYFTTKAQGTGLGVPIARRIAEAHGGRMSAHVKGERIDVAVHLPLPSAGPTPEGKGATFDEYTGSGR
jgi:two-component system, NtrC family, sensor histidine kinase HydH